MIKTKDFEEEKVYKWISVDYAGLPGKVKTGGGKMEDKNQGREREGVEKNRKIDGGGKIERLKVVVEPGGGNVRR